MFNKIEEFLRKPELYAKSTNKFWDDEHISKILLEAHLNPEWDASSRKPAFMDSSVSWISEIAPPKQFNNLLVLGCGPGLYTERFANAGYTVTGVDFSKRSIAYANRQTQINNSNIKYYYQDYLKIDFCEEFEIITLIFCDFGALSALDRKILLNKIYKALKPNGKFILDVFTPIYHRDNEENHTWEYCTDGGFWSANPYICLNSFYRYNEDNTILRQHIVQTAKSTDCYNVWEHYFTQESLLAELQEAGFKKSEFFGDIAGKKISQLENTICGVFTK